MTSAESAVTTAPEPSPAAAPSAPPGRGWLVVAAKEFADQLLSVRFVVLFAVLGLAAAVPLYIAAEQIRSLFKIFVAKYGLDQPIPPLDFSAFQPPVPRSGQLRLF